MSEGHNIERRGRIVAPLSVHVFLSSEMPRVYAVASFDDKHSPKTQKDMRDALSSHSPRLYTESVYFGRIGGEMTYDIYVYPDAKARAACYALVAGEG